MFVSLSLPPNLFPHLSLQYFPVASSTICHLLLSIDRYDTVKRPRVLHLRKKQLIPILVALLAWASAATVSVPFLFVHQRTVEPSSPINRTTTTTTTITNYNYPSSNLPLRPPAAAIEPLNTILLSRKPLPEPTPTPLDSYFLRNGTRVQFRNRICTSYELHPRWYTPFILIHTLCVFILPGLGILLNHVRVRKKLCALSLTARAAHGELPLPMPLLRRPTGHVIIVTGMANTNLTRGNVTATTRNERSRNKGGAGGGRGGSGTTGTKGSGKGEQNRKPTEREVKRKPQSKRFGRRHPPPKDDDPNDPPLDERPMIVSSSQHNNNLRATASNASNVQQMGNPEFPLPQTSTLIFRRRLANILMTAAFLFILCWAPYTVAVVYYESRGKRSKIVTDLGLLIGECNLFNFIFCTPCQRAVYQANALHM